MEGGVWGKKGSGGGGEWGVEAEDYLVSESESCLPEKEKV